MKRLIAACSLGALVVLLWRLRPAPLPELEPFDEPGGGFDWPSGWQPSTTGTSPIHFRFNDGTTGPGRWDSATGRIEKAEATW